MPEITKDRRVQRTRELLLETLLNLLREQGFEKLTIQDLLDRSGVGRATFYAHFQSKEDLLVSSLSRLRGNLVQEWNATGGVHHAPQERLGFALPFFRHLEGHRDVYRTTLGRESELTVERYMRRMLRDLVREDLYTCQVPKQGTVALELAVQYVVGSLWAVVVWWMESKSPLPAVELHQMFQRITLPGLDAALA